MGLPFLGAARTQNRAHRRCWAAHARAATSGGRPCWRRAICTPTAGRCFKAQADPGQLGAQVGVAGLGEPAAVDGGAAGVFAWDQPAEPHELAGRGEPAPVGDLGGQRQRAQPGDPAVGGQARDLPGKRRPVAPAGKVGLHRVQVRVADLDHGQVVPERLGHGGLVEPLGAKPRLVLERPGRPAPPHPPVTQQELAQPVPRPGEITDHVGAGAAQVPYRLLPDGGDADTDQLAGAVQPGQAAAVAPVGLDLVARRLGDQQGGDHLAADPMLASSRASSKPVGPAWEQARSMRGSPRRPTSLRTDASSWAIRSTSGTC
jgi:hypothetical protein